MPGINRKIDGGPDEVMYLEGSDQHRGWFQSSLLESCGTRGRAPFDIVLTHGFTLDEKGRKMSKSLGNQTFPQDVIRASGADILRLWVASVDYSDDQRIGPEILKAVGDNYRKLRNTIRWMLGNAGASRAGRPDRARFEMADLDRLMLHKLAELDVRVREAYASFDYARVIAALTAFMNADLSAFYFDIRKDALYCDPPSSPRRRGALEAIEQIFRAVTIWLAPVLVFTTEEAWAARDPSHRSIHLEQFPAIPAAWRDERLAKNWETIRALRLSVTGAIEIARANKEIGSSLEAAPRVWIEAARAHRRAERRRFRRSVHHFGYRDRDGDAGSARRVPPSRAPGRRGRRRAGERGQMRALLALFRSVDRLARFSRRHPARCGSAARAQSARSAAVTPRSVRRAHRARGLCRRSGAEGGGAHALGRGRSGLDAARPVSRSDPALEPGHLLQPVRARVGGWPDPPARLILLAIALLGWWLSNCPLHAAAAGLGAIIGGALGNLSDRVVHGAVVDYLDLHALGRHFFVFNLADAAINVGVALLVIDLAFGSRAGGWEEQPTSRPRAK